MTVHCVTRPRRPFIAFPGHAVRSLRSPVTQAAVGHSSAGASSFASAFGGASSFASVLRWRLLVRIGAERLDDRHGSRSPGARAAAAPRRTPRPRPRPGTGIRSGRRTVHIPIWAARGPEIGCPAAQIDRCAQGNGRRDAGDALDGLSAGARRAARPVGDRRDLLSRRFLVDARRVLRRRGVLRGVRLPHHVAVARRAGSHRRHQARSVLATPRSTPAAGSVHRPCRGRGVVDLRRQRRAAVGAAARPAVGDLLRRQLGADRRRRALLQRRSATPPARLEPGRRGAVVPVLAAGVRRSPPHPPVPLRHRRVCSWRSRWP